MMKFTTLKCALLGIVGAFTMLSCTESYEEDVVKGADKKVTVVSLYSEYSANECKNLLAANVLVEANKAIDLDLIVPADCQKVYMKYATKSGDQVKELSLKRSSIRSNNADFDWSMSDKASVSLILPEDAVQTTSEKDAGFRFLHSTGVAMFEDNWPTESGKDNDLNDVVVEYDFKVTECQNEELFPSQGYKEGLLMTLDIRAKGGRYPTKFGVVLEGLDKKFISEVTTSIVLKKGQGMMDVLAPGKAGVSNVTIHNKGGIKYCEVKVDLESGSPIVTLDGLAQLVNLVDGKDEKNNNFYQVRNGVLEVGKPMLRAEILFTGKLRANSTDGIDQLEAFRNLILDTKNQNFFIVTHDKKETHMKGYKPTLAYASKYEADSQGLMADDATYCNKNGFVWGIKVPAGVNHAHEEVLFADAYPRFNSWAKSNGTQDKDWYKHPTEVDTWNKLIRYW